MAPQQEKRNHRVPTNYYIKIYKYEMDISGENKARYTEEYFNFNIELPHV